MTVRPFTEQLATPPAATPALGDTDGQGHDATVHAHYFIGGCDWLITEYDPATGQMFGWACRNDRQNAELGYSNYYELAEVRAQGIYPVEAETDWEPVTLTHAITTLDKNAGRAQGVSA